MRACEASQGVHCQRKKRLLFGGEWLQPGGSSRRLQRVCVPHVLCVAGSSGRGGGSACRPLELVVRRCMQWAMVGPGAPVCTWQHCGVPRALAGCCCAPVHGRGRQGAAAPRRPIRGAGGGRLSGEGSREKTQALTGCCVITRVVCGSRLCEAVLAGCVHVCARVCMCVMCAHACAWVRRHVAASGGVRGVPCSIEL